MFVESIKALAEAASVADPSPELAIVAAVIVAVTRGRPKRVRRLVREMRTFEAAHREMAKVIRLKGGETDDRVMSGMARASAWLDQMEPFLLMMARK